jgi:putative ATP-dependent endonuclease of OLD family
MQVRHIKIQRFRGIKSLDWQVDGQLICLVGPGDSTKSTILSAVDCALSPRWKLDFDDSDFYNGDTSNPFSITVTVGGLPTELKSDSRFGLELRGWGDDGLHDEPQEEDELVISIQLTVDKSLEPKWVVVNDRRPEGRPISANDRDSLGAVRIGDFLDRHLTWTLGSILSRLTGSGEELTLLLAEISRAARSSLSNASLPKLTAATEKLTEISKGVGVKPHTAFAPHLDTKAVDVSAGAISLHDGEVPIRLSGLGTRRLITLALQTNAVTSGAVALIDEVEHGLEPHRLRRLLCTLRTEFEVPGNGSLGQLLMTTHSPVVVDELPCDELRVVRCDNGTVTIHELDAKTQSTVRRSPEAFLSSGIIVCEGETEIGLCRALDNWWMEAGNYDPLAVKGISLVDGKGRNSEHYVEKMVGIGYSTLFFGDSDRTLNPSQSDLEAAGATVITWGDSCCLEQRITKDLPWAGIQELLSLAVSIKDEDKVRAAVCGKFSLDKTSLRDAIASWPEGPELRTAIGAAAKDGDWFKRTDIGEQIGKVATKYLPVIPKSDLAVTISALRTWIDTHE